MTQKKKCNNSLGLTFVARYFLMETIENSSNKKNKILLSKEGLRGRVVSAPGTMSLLSGFDSLETLLVACFSLVL